MSFFFRVSSDGKCRKSLVGEIRFVLIKWVQSIHQPAEGQSFKEVLGVDPGKFFKCFIKI